ncbi:MAG: hypothetical protein ACO4CF_16045 [bacterium]
MLAVPREEENEASSEDIDPEILQPVTARERDIAVVAKDRRAHQLRAVDA